MGQNDVFKQSEPTQKSSVPQRERQKKTQTPYTSCVTMKGAGWFPAPNTLIP